ncbi:hypothetical protein E2C01_052057 [Portunus trituberculatus]|uniref:Uncharacterized protein n=1 Tax=Portunus trituberculatus TaxID=210409 RepID=A0A5B7GKM7_PORTR|nr:hypothetical protein [Portunus trituberculatus]
MPAAAFTIDHDPFLGDLRFLRLKNDSHVRRVTCGRCGGDAALVTDKPDDALAMRRRGGAAKGL